MSDQTCNGWRNYATWRVHLEILQDWCHAQIEDGEHFDDQYSLVQAMESVVDEAITDFGELDDSSLAVSYAQAFVEDVDYYEIAAHYGELYAEPEEADEEEDDGEDDPTACICEDCGADLPNPYANCDSCADEE